MLVLTLAGLTALPASALYKVVNPDGSVTYTDRPPPAATNARVTPLNARGAGASSEADLAWPADLRQAMQRHPVTLYTAPDCRPCESARAYLRQRGIPYAERLADTEEDAVQLERLVGGRTVPSLRIGGQPLRGFAQADWAVYLDAAGYPRESRLPRGWTPPAPTPLIARAPAPEPAATSAAPTAAPAPAEAEPARPVGEPAPTDIRF